MKPVGYLGIDWGIKDGYYFVKRIIKGAQWDTEIRSALDVPGLKIKEGDFILAVNGIPIDPDNEPYSAFQGLADKTIELTVNNKPSSDGAWTILVKTLNDETRLRNLQWIESNRKRVEEATNGRVGYIYVPSTGLDGQYELVRMFYAQYEKEGLIIICGRYEGIDERIKELVVDYEICIGDYILTGGEIAALAIMESTCRLVPDVLEKEDAKTKESFVEGLLDYPHYTRPAEFAGVNVPEVLLSGNHLKIEEWRAKKSLELTINKRPDIIKGNY